MSNIKDLSGQKFNKLTVISFSHSNNESFWLCKCDCGNSKIIKSSHLKSGHTKSCGCIRRESNVSKHYLYNTWSNMINRCYNKKSTSYKNYGGRGVFVCSEWRESFSTFLRDMGDRPEGLTLERKDNFNGYKPDNCKWATTKEQANNRRKPKTGKKYEAFGVFRTISEWSMETGLSYACINTRLKRGWSVEDSVTKLLIE